MKKISIRTLIVIIISLFTTIGFAQSDSTESVIDVSCDLMSRYVWRGTDFGQSPSIQPGIEYSIGGFYVGAWGAFTTNLYPVQEADLYIGYTFVDMFSLTFTDYFFPDELNPDYNYFDFDKNTTGHVFETTLSFDGTEKLPLSILFAANVWGADAQRLNSDGSVKGLQYSSYAEVAYSYKNMNIFMGLNLTTPDETLGESGYYGNTLGVVNLGITGTKNIQLTNKYSLPLSVSLITNPQAEKIYMVAGFSF